uniref:Acetyl-CoA carboxylase n=2 Tax=Mantoniella antarctica TaxID=81844 RepID=A0A7S0X6J4_9CHLO|mmetsp:Transcript_21960/g.54328  ORF Transcript_21960/g.54328 Transcript_21960/m.54328 type:complete len:2152 (+) Transcript_21960:332-6787(+)
MALSAAVPWAAPSARATTPASGRRSGSIRSGFLGDRRAVGHHVKGSGSGAGSASTPASRPVPSSGLAPSHHAALPGDISAKIAVSAPSDTSSDTASSTEALARYVAAHGGKRIIRKVLIANNGMAATKSIISMRRWAYNELGDENAIKFIAMATPEDLKANAEFIRYADDFIEVPGGKNSNNYANVNLIVDIAEREGVDAVWPGWGHASENPKLPTALKEHGIQFIGPTAPVMSVLGDKIAANILAQTAKVPSIPWSGTGLEAELTAEGTIPDEIFKKAMVTTVEESIAAANSIGYPVMLKASEGGGGKGIRMSASDEEMRVNFEMVKAEVPGSPMFMMQLCQGARHLEVQIVGDEYGDAVALSGRDCSTQRRFQKIFEEAPPSVADPAVFREMEKAAQRLTRNIGYIGAGTVEYLYNVETKNYYFLELNPRLQVEHPVTEGITGVNLPATQLQVAMGIPLSRIPDIRRFYNRDPEADTAIDFMEEDYVLPQRHVMAARITAENPDEGFKPTSGGIERVSFQSTPNVWGYFSVGANGGVHEFADSQFGHIFANGATREEARKSLVLALKGIQVRGEIRTAVEYLVQLLETSDFRTNAIDTSWLDGIIKAKSIAMKEDPHTIVASAVLWRAFRQVQAEESAFKSFWQKGQTATQGVERLTEFPIEITYQDVKYSFAVQRRGPDSLVLSLQGKGGDLVDARIRERSDGVLLVIWGGRTHEIDGLEEPLGLRMVLDGQTWLLPNQFDPSELRTDVTGKLIRFLQSDGGEVVAGKPYAEVEAMKMVMPLIATESGMISHAKSGGAVIQAGDMLGSLTLKDPNKVKKISAFGGEFRCASGGGLEAPPSAAEALEVAINHTNLILDGYVLPVEETVNNLLERLCDPALPEFAGGRWTRACSILNDIVDRYLAVESLFAGKKEDSVMREQTRQNSDNLDALLKVVVAHARIKPSTKMVLSLLKQAPTLPQRVMGGPIGWADDHAPVSDDFRASIERLSNLRGADYGELALTASNILLEKRLPSIDKRLDELRKILMGGMGLNRAWGTAEAGDLKSLIESPTLAVDLLPSLFVDADAAVADAALDVYTKRVYRAHNVISTEIVRADGLDSMNFKFQFNTYPEASPLRCGIMAVTSNLERAKSLMPAILDRLAAHIGDARKDTPIHVLHLALSAQPEDAALAERCAAVLSEHRGRMAELGVKFVNVISYMPPNLPNYYTFTAANGYQENPLYRGERPTVAHLLELARLENYTLTRLPTVNRDLHVYVGESKQGFGKRGLQKHMLLRRISHSRDAAEGGIERVLVKAVEALDLARLDPRTKGASSGRIYINFLPLQTDSPFDVTVSSLKTKVLEFISRNSTELLTQQVDEIEMRFRIADNSESAVQVPIRVMATSMSGQWLKVDVYREYLDPQTGKATQFCMIGKDGAEEACFLEPYPMPGTLQQKRSIARAIGTTYIYDFLGLIEKAMVLEWRQFIAGPGMGDVPGDMFRAEELILNTEDGELTKAEASRIAGSNEIGMVAWQCFMKTPEYPGGREIVLVGNDCTFMSGSFGVKEDDFYNAVSVYAREKGLPRVYIASNSGARIGLVEELKPYFKVAWNDSSNPSLGFQYLYLSPEDYAAFPPGTVNATETVENGERRMRLDDIIGQIHGIGVENLRGSGMIAGEQSAAYADAFTLSYITGRSVGIGAYLCRLGQRNIQMTNGPLILTGYLALNKLLGRDVYTSQDQLGGPQVMMPNGVSHMQVEDDQEGVRAILRWLSYVPSTCFTRSPALPSADPSNRKIQFKPTKTPYNPRDMIAGVDNADGTWTGGFFDKGSWTETLADWGKSVVCGRARLGGIPMGVIAVETRLMEQRIPADPANPESRESVLQQAGQVWFPDSAHKTATAIRDFNNAENLPLIIFANWRGFSGGTRDMYGEILKFGAMIVDELRVYRHPVFVYIPPNGELRGGAWVVVDPTINEARMEMYADVESRGGILEPPGICEVKFRDKDQKAVMHRLDPVLLELDQDPEAHGEDISAREAQLLPMYTQVAHEFADLHDRSGRMLAKGVIRDVVEWENARGYFHARLKRRLKTDELAMEAGAEPADVEARLEGVATAAGVDWSKDADVTEWLEAAAEVVSEEVTAIGREAAIEEALETLAGLDDTALRVVMEKMRQVGAN